MDRVKKDYTPPPGDIDPVVRTAQAVEAVAYYLDRIESHLAALVAAQHSPNVPLIGALQGIHKALDKR